MRISEIFCSLQGEGHYTGTPSIFIRTSGCNLRCPFCDTEHEGGLERSVTDIVAECLRYIPRHAVITGGEPSLQPELPALVDALHDKGFFVQIETNGTRPLPTTIDWVTCSPKEGAEVVLKTPQEVKVVYVGQELSHYEQQFPTSALYLQPCDWGDAKKNRANLQSCIDFLLNHPRWRLSLQTHKLIGVR